MIRRDAWRFGALVVATGAVVMIAIVLTSPHDQLFRSDGLFFRLVAEHPFGHSAAMAEPKHAAEFGDAYRYGRVLYPFVAWVLAFGHAPWVRWTLPIVDVLALGGAAVVAAELVARRGFPVVRAAALFVVPGVWLALSIAFSEVFVLALLLLFCLLVIDGRVGAAMAVGALALLARETAALAIIPVGLVSLRARRWREVLGWTATVLPLLAWWTWVHHRVGQWPPLDNSLSRRKALSYPLGGAITVIRNGADGYQWVMFALAAVTVVAAIWVFVRVPWWPVSWVALLFGLLLLCLGSNAFQYPGEAIRLMTPAQALVALSFAAGPSATIASRST